MKDYMRIIFIAVFACVIGIPCILVLDHFEEKARKEQLIKVLTLVHRVQEESYFEGQKDYMNGDIRISKTNNCYQWVKSPWDTQAVDSNLFKLPCEK